jgi:hypothetical protein
VLKYADEALCLTIAADFIVYTRKIMKPLWSGTVYFIQTETAISCLQNIVTNQQSTSPYGERIATQFPHEK